MAEYETLKGQYAGYSAESDASNKLKEVSNSLKVPRGHVQPDPIKTPDREKILKPLSLAVIQTALFTILLALVELLVLPAPYGSYLVFLTLCVGTSVGIYLSSR